MLARLRSWIGRAPKQAETRSDIGAAIGGGRSAPARRANGELLGAFADSPWLHTGTARIAESVGATVWTVSAPQPGGAKDATTARYKAAQRGDGRALADIHRKGEFREIDDHPLLEFLHTGNPRLSGQACIEVTQIFLDLMGEAYWALDIGGNGRPTGFWPLAPTWIEKHPTDAEPFFAVSIRGQRAKIPVERMVWFKAPDPVDPYGRGAGIGRALGDELDADEYAAGFIKSFFYNGASVDTVVSLKGATSAQVREFEAAWNNKFRGPANAHRTAVTGAEVDVKTFGHSFKDMAIVELRKFFRDTVLQSYGVPPEILGIVEDSNRATIHGAELIFAKYNLTPRINRIRSVIQERIVPMFDGRLVLGFVSPIPEDRDHKLSVMKAAPQAFTIAEWRQSAGYEPRPGDETATLPMQSFGALPPAPEPSDKALLPSVRKDAEPDIKAVLEALRPERLADEMDPVFRRRVRDWAQGTIDGLGLDATFDMLNPLVVGHLEELSGARISGINETTREAIKAELVEGVEAGESIADLSKRVRGVFDDASKARAEAIARSEVGRSSNFAQFDAWRQTAIVKGKQWVATRGDGRTRDTHLDLDGTVVGLDEKFRIGALSADHPGDFGDPAEDINERCTLVPVLDGHEPKAASELDAVWKTYDQALRPWERETMRAVRRAFDHQLEDVLKALRR